MSGVNVVTLMVTASMVAVEPSGRSMMRHWTVKASPSGSVVALASSASSSPCVPLRSPPASQVGGELDSMTRAISARHVSVPSLTSTRMLK